MSDTSKPTAAAKPATDSLEHLDDLLNPKSAPAAPAKPVKIECPHCGKEADVPADLIGKKVKCPKCSTVYTATKVIELNLSDDDDDAKPKAAPAAPAKPAPKLAPPPADDLDGASDSVDLPAPPKPAPAPRRKPAPPPRDTWGDDEDRDYPSPPRRRDDRPAAPRGIGCSTILLFVLLGALALGSVYFFTATGHIPSWNSPKKVATIADDWAPAQYIKVEKDHIEVLKLEKDHTLFISDLDGTNWKQITSTGRFSLKLLGWPEMPSTLQVAFRKSGNINVQSPEDGPTRQFSSGVTPLTAPVVIPKK